MTLGGFALAVGILVDNGTVVIENIERHVGPGRSRCETRDLNGTGEVGLPTVLSTLCICIVFVPVFLLQGTAKYLFSPLSVSVCMSLLASLALSFTLVPVLFKYLMRVSAAAHADATVAGAAAAESALAGACARRRARSIAHSLRAFRAFARPTANARRLGHCRNRA